MAAENGRTKREAEKKKNFTDFIDDVTSASSTGSTVGVRFLKKLNKKGANADKLYDELKKLGYGGVDETFFKKMFEIYATSKGFKKAVGETGY